MKQSLIVQSRDKQMQHINLLFDLSLKCCTRKFFSTVAGLPSVELFFFTIIKNSEALGFSITIRLLFNFATSEMLSFCLNGETLKTNLRRCPVSYFEFLFCVYIIVDFCILKYLYNLLLKHLASYQNMT